MDTSIKLLEDFTGISIGELSKRAERNTKEIRDLIGKGEKMLSDCKVDEEGIAYLVTQHCLDADLNCFAIQLEEMFRSYDTSRGGLIRITKADFEEYF